MSQPTRDLIDQVCSITGVDEETAKILLKKNNNDANSACNAYFEDPSKSIIPEPVPSNTWQYQDNIPFSGDHGMSMSRPPSRVGASHIDLSGEHATASSSNVKTLKEQEDDDHDLQRAVAESLKQNLPAQENGVTQTSSHFGPAKSDYNYDGGNWALTAYSTSREVIEHPPPSKRRRLGDAPAFLRGSKDTGYLGPLLTIYHNIPLAREALLMPALKVHAYGHDSSWWSGATDENNKALSSDNTLRIDQNERNLLTEVQCLMAFLDRTTRAYGSVDALADLQAVRNQGVNTLFHKFLKAWGAAALRQAPQDQLTQVFSSSAVKAEGPNNGPPDERTLYCVEPYVNHAPDETLTDLLDTTIWNDSSGDVVDDVWISHCAEIFTVRLQEPTAVARKVDINLDPVWYADRYMYDCREEMQQIRGQVQIIKRQIEQLTHRQRRCQIVTSNNRNLDIAEVLSAALQASTIAASKIASANGLLDSRQPAPDDGVPQSDMDELGSELQNVLQRIRQRLIQLEQRKEELRARSRQIAMQLTTPTPDRPDVLHHKYTLQGVATKPGVTYFRRQNPNADLLEPDQRDEEGMSYEWWRSCWKQEEIQQAAHPPMVGPVTQAQAETAGGWASDESSTWSLDRVFQDDVLEAVKNENSPILLVYANENGIKVPRSSLSLSLRHFVDRDNQAFADDCALEEGAVPDSSADNEPETEFEDVPLIDPTRSTSSVRELTPMSTSSPDHDDGGQPRLKAANVDSAVNAAERPPSYEGSIGEQEMQERKENKIGLYAEQLLQRYGDEAGKGTGEKERNGDFLDIKEPR